MSQDGLGTAVPGRAGALVRAWRRAARLTQEELAQRAGLGVRTVRDLELGRVRRPHPGSVQLLAAALLLTGPDRALLEAAVRDESWPAADRSGQRPPGRPAHPVPGQLPADVPAFTGRTAELSELDGLLRA